MKEKIIVQANRYADSVTLMLVSQRVQQLPGIEAALVGMGSPLNLDVLQTLDFQEEISAGANDLIIALRGRDDDAVQNALDQMEALMRVQGTSSSGQAEERPKSLVQALAKQKGNLALISVPGVYAPREARKALEQNLHVMLFSDNVSLADEVELKKLAHSRELLLMGPDCGTAILNGVPLAFANVVRRGVIGIVAASGTGAQEVSVQIDRMGQGVSQAIGTGGRDLHEAVGGIMMLDGIEALRQDPETKVIVVVSKPAAPAVAAKVLRALSESGKPSVLCVIESKGGIRGNAEVTVARNLLETAQKAVQLAGGAAIPQKSADQAEIYGFASALRPEQKYVRGLFSGGTLCDEAMAILSEKLGLIYSYGPLDPAGQLPDPNKSFQNTVLDLGDDFFTVGRPHPMIDLTLRKQRIIEEAKDPEVAVILLDVVLGYGAHPDPAGELVPVLVEARGKAAGGSGGSVVFVAYVCGTAGDPQDYNKQVKALQEAGVRVFASNVEAAEFTAGILEAAQGGGQR
ncbi:Succinate-CoA ligase (ADP-forming) [Acididesulfobacillus acetoxydans]|uniref:Protein FdrA n=1 Tax=Acididesulfobacillus acetoxydans TaxID=1561005 RepID=A0A8S0XB95_9FIRM|nr:acyl-CoA synthetase FdrA [Acididesulfobacillus acetoxydans]CAA7600946.1 Succinate-CoA ligase (ADP-forming) [Acididesulfobacillus acetoxydans]CEJ08898.1 Protein FdrA [Acididesulfobacillus acetoxydans]